MTELSKPQPPSDELGREVVEGGLPQLALTERARKDLPKAEKLGDRPLLRRGKYWLLQRKSGVTLLDDKLNETEDIKGNRAATELTVGTELLKNTVFREASTMGDIEFRYSKADQNIQSKRSPLPSRTVERYLTWALPEELSRHNIRGDDYLGNATYKASRYDIVGQLKLSLAGLDAAPRVVDDQDKIGWYSPDTGAFLIYQTVGPNGEQLAPRNWIRLDPAIVLAQPELAKSIQSLDASPLPNGYVIKTSPKSIELQASGGAQIFEDNIFAANHNLVVDPANPNVIFYCQQSDPREIIRVDTSTRPGPIEPEAAPLAQKYLEIINLQLDPSGEFFSFQCGHDTVLLDKRTLQEIGRLTGTKSASITKEGEIAAVTTDNSLMIFRSNLADIRRAIEQQKTTELLQGINTTDLFRKEPGGSSTPSPEQHSLAERFGPIVEKYQADFEQRLQAITDLAGMAPMHGALDVLRRELQRKGLAPDETDYIVHEVSQPVLAAERRLAQTEAEQELEEVRRTLAAGGLSITSIATIRQKLDALADRKALVDPSTGQAINRTEEEFTTQTAELFAREGEQIEKQAAGLIEQVQQELGRMTNIRQFDDWVENTNPQIRSRLGFLSNNCPLEAVATQAQLLKLSGQLNQLTEAARKRFETEYASVRQKAAELMDQRLVHVRENIANAFARYSRKPLSNRTAAEVALEQSLDIQTIWQEIHAIQQENPEAGKSLEADFKSARANFLSAIERGGRLKIADTGQQMVSIGETPFPKWEARVKEHAPSRLDVTFLADKGTHGADIHGDIGLVVAKDDGTTTTIRLYEGTPNEDEYRHGAAVWLGERYAPPTYVTAAEYAAFKRDYQRWQGGYEQSEGQPPPETGPVASLKRELQTRLQALHALTIQRRDSANWTPEQERDYREKIRDYEQFSIDHHIGLLHRIDHMRTSQQEEHVNGKGFVPNWQSHWVMDQQTESYLEEMAKLFKMQLTTHEGMLNLKGHAGTGKDILIKMFCHLTNRLYFTIDCSKWTTEFELSEDVVLEAENGASQTVKVPSVVLNAITTPGAIMYFNEFNAMPEQAQIFLHGLLDEKRSLTLKTSSGKSIVANPSVLLASSMNPGYPGTFEPQFATKSRLVSLPIDYPPATVPAADGDANQSPLVNSAEALRIAREVGSLADLTYDQNPASNEFNQLWNSFVNGVQNGAPQPSPEQRFDLEVILALVQFSDRLRADFIKVFEKNRDARNALPVSQPLTGRELRRAAYGLSQIPVEQKLSQSNPEAVARYLLESFYLRHYDKVEDREKIRTALQTWTTQKRV